MDGEAKACACSGAAAAPPPHASSIWSRGGWLLVALPAWVGLYMGLKPLADLLTFRVLGLVPGSRLGEAGPFSPSTAPRSSCSWAWWSLV